MAAVRDGRRVALRSIGCRTNRAEMTALGDELAGASFILTDSLAGADVVIINSCAVTAESEAATHRLLDTIARDSPHARVLVTGCLAELSGETLLRRHQIRWVVANGAKHDILAILVNDRAGFFAPLKRDGSLPVSETVGVPGSGGRTRFSLKIQEGCGRSCAYCVVPRLRGKSRSADAHLVLERARRALDRGYKEIILTGTHIGQYGDGMGTGLTELVGKLLSLEGIFRLRLSTLDVAELSGEFLALPFGQGKLCDHLHLGIQSFSLPLLAAMGRPLREEGLEALCRFRDAHPQAGLGGDFIVGFPGEREEWFEETIAMVKRLGFSYGHVFRFSPRPETRAAALGDCVPEVVKRERGERLRAIFCEEGKRFAARFAGTRHRIIVEQGGVTRGFTDNYLRVELPSSPHLHNSWLDVILEGTIREGRVCPALPETDGKS